MVGGVIFPFIGGKKKAAVTNFDETAVQQSAGVVRLSVRLSSPDS
jgi:hypothetical protein